MPQSFSQIHAHLVFSTKNRIPFLANDDVRVETHNYLGGVSKQHDCPVIRVGGAADHVHLLAFLGRETAQADWVRDLKRASSIWVKERFKGIGMDDFAWQSGYGCFAICHDRLERVVQYVESQMEHHRKVGFQDEYRAILTKLGIQWDERYVWD
jgi:REP element-mobilizing transposase RayT